MSTSRNKPPMLIGNLHEKGWRDTARAIYREARQLNVLILVVYVDEHQDVWVQKARKSSPIDQTHWLATYDRSTAPNEIEDDLIHHLRSTINTRIAA